MCINNSQVCRIAESDLPSTKAEAPFQRVEFWLLLQEPLRAEHCWILVDTGILADIPGSAVKALSTILIDARSPLVEDHDGARWDEIVYKLPVSSPVDLVVVSRTMVVAILHCSVCDANGVWWMPPDGLLEDGFDVGQVIAICECRQPVSPHNRVKLSLCLSLNVRVHCHRQEERRQRCK